MTVQFDGVSATWRVVDDEGTILKSGLPTDAAALRWIDERVEHVFEDVGDRNIKSAVET